MFTNALKISGLSLLTLAGCAELAATGGTKGEDNVQMAATAVGILGHGLGANVNFVLLHSNEKSCATRKATSEPDLQIFIKLEGGVRYDWCDYDDTSPDYEFAQRDYYSVKQNGGGWNYGYSAAFNCNSMAGYIVDQVGSAAYPVVCKPSGGSIAPKRCAARSQRVRRIRARQRLTTQSEWLILIEGPPNVA